MPSQSFSFHFRGKVGNAHFIKYQEVPGLLFDAQVTKVENRSKTGYACTYHATKISPRAFKLEVHFCGYVGKYFDSSVYVAAYWEGADAKVQRDQDHGQIETKEIVFSIKGNGKKELITQEQADVGGKIIDCAVVKIEGHPGANFFVQKLDERGITCSGGFVTESDEEDRELEATVTAVVALEKS